MLPHLDEITESIRRNHNGMRITRKYARARAEIVARLLTNADREGSSRVHVIGPTYMSESGIQSVVIMTTDRFIAVSTEQGGSLIERSAICGARRNEGVLHIEATSGNVDCVMAKSRVVGHVGAMERAVWGISPQTVISLDCAVADISSSTFVGGSYEAQHRPAAPPPRSVPPSSSATFGNRASRRQQRRTEKQHQRTLKLIEKHQREQMDGLEHEKFSTASGECPLFGPRGRQEDEGLAQFAVRRMPNFESRLRDVVVDGDDRMLHQVRTFVEIEEEGADAVRAILSNMINRGGAYAFGAKFAWNTLGLGSFPPHRPVISMACAVKDDYAPVPEAVHEIQQATLQVCMAASRNVLKRPEDAGIPEVAVNIWARGEGVVGSAAELWGAVSWKWDPVRGHRRNKEFRILGDPSDPSRREAVAGLAASLLRLLDDPDADTSRIPQERSDQSSPIRRDDRP